PDDSGRPGDLVRAGRGRRGNRRSDSKMILEEPKIPPRPHGKRRRQEIEAMSWKRIARIFAALGIVGIVAIPAGLNTGEQASRKSSSRVAHELAELVKPEAGARPEQAPKPMPAEAPRPVQNPGGTPQPSAQEEAFLTTLPGILTALAAVITAIAGLVV